MGDCDDLDIFLTMCRLCMSRNNELINLQLCQDFKITPSTSNILELIERFTTVKIDPLDSLPQKICASCVSTMKSMLAFQNICKQSDGELHSMKRRLDDNKIKTEIFDELDAKDYSAVYVGGTLDEADVKFKIEINFETADILPMPNKNILKDADGTKRCQMKIACHICGKLYDSSGMKSHMYTHSDSRPYECDVSDCKKTFKAPWDVQNHKKMCHVKPTLYCDMCGKGYKRRSTLITHMTYHFEPKIPCPICKKMFRNREAILKHRVVHSQERRFKCGTCGKSFQTGYTLRTHERVHTQEKPYSCFCGLAFAYKCLLKAHTEKYHNVGNFE